MVRVMKVKKLHVFYALSLSALVVSAIFCIRVGMIAVLSEYREFRDAVIEGSVGIESDKIIKCVGGTLQEITSYYNGEYSLSRPVLSIHGRPIRCDI